MNGQSTAHVPIETVYELILYQDWDGVLDFIHRWDTSLSTEPRLDHIVDTFISEYFGSLPVSKEKITDPPGSEAKQPELWKDANRNFDSFFNEKQVRIAEKLVLFHVSNRLILNSGRFRDVILRLLGHYQSEPARALDFARFLPEEPECKNLLNRFAPPEKRSEPSVMGTGVHVTEQAHTHKNSAALPLFKSFQEERLYDALRNEFPKLLAVPNVALHSIVSMDAIRASLTVRERDFFYRALIDCVLFDPSNHYRIVVCIELDSPLHDDDIQIERDEMKNRILSIAGFRLIRIRPDRKGVPRSVFQEVLSSIGGLSSR